MSIFLTPDNIRTEKIQGSTITIKEKIIPDNALAIKDIYYLGGGLAVRKGEKLKQCLLLEGGKPKGITVHNTPEIKVSSKTTMAEQYTRATYPNCNMGGVLVHYYVRGVDVWQNLKENERGVHAGSGNSSTIAIEVIGNDTETEETAQKLIAYLCMKYNLNPKIDVYSHNFWNFAKNEIVVGAKKNCPLWILPHWNDFIAGISNYIINQQGSNTLYSVQVGSFLNKSYAENLKEELIAKGYKAFIVIK